MTSDLTLTPDQPWEDDPDKERAARTMAGAPLDKKHEEAARRSLELIEAIRRDKRMLSYGELVDLDLHPDGPSSPHRALRQIGWELGADGGHWLMVVAAQRVVALSQGEVSIRYLESYWEGICEWYY